MKYLFVLCATLLLCFNATIASAESALVCKINNEIPTITATVTDLHPNVLRLALDAYYCAKEQGIGEKQLLTIIDYSLPSSEKRLWVLDLSTNKVIMHTLVAHGKHTGGLMAQHFSDISGSKQTSLGLFLTEKSFRGPDGYSLRIKGLEDGYNDKVEHRVVVIHGAWYVSDSFAKKHGYLGRSWGCPAVPLNEVKELIDDIKEGTLMFAYYPDKKWLDDSTFLHCKPKSS